MERRPRGRRGRPSRHRRGRGASRSRSWRSGSPTSSAPPTASSTRWATTGAGRAACSTSSPRFRAARAPAPASAPPALEDLDALLGELRRVKDARRDGAAARRRRASARAGHLAAMGRPRPGVGEWELEAALEGTFRRAGRLAAPPSPPSWGRGRTPPSSTTSPTTAASGRGDLVLVDAGAEWGMYCLRHHPHLCPSPAASPRRSASCTTWCSPPRRRASPPSRAGRAGHRGPRRRRARARRGDACAWGCCRARRARDELIAARRPPPLLPAPDLPLARPRRARRRPLPRGRRARAGCGPAWCSPSSPGLYVPGRGVGVPSAYRGIGIRIEDDVLVTAGGPEVLTRGVPVAPEEVEALMWPGLSAARCRCADLHSGGAATRLIACRSARGGQICRPLATT